jgi:hypothetical protein
MHLNIKPSTVPTPFTSLVPPHLVLMEVCEQKFAIIHYFCIPLPSVYYHKFLYTTTFSVLSQIEVDKLALYWSLTLLHHGTY